MLVGTIFEDNKASDAGGAIQADGGSVVLTNQTRLRRNDAPHGKSIVVSARADVQYHLPTPMAHWVFISDGGIRSTLSVGHVDDDFPYTCSGLLLKRTSLCACPHTVLPCASAPPCTVHSRLCCPSLQPGWLAAHIFQWLSLALHVTVHATQGATVPLA